MKSSFNPPPAAWVRPFRAILGLAWLGVVGGLPAQTLIHHYEGGENDGRVVTGETVESTNDSGSTGTDLSLVGSGVTFSDTAFGDSTLSYAFNGSGHLAGAVNSTLTSGSSFFMELRFNTTGVSTNQVLLYNGNTSTSGIGLYLQGNQLSALRASVSIQNVATVGASTWNYAALVYDNGSGSVFLNGTRYDLDFSSGFNAPLGSLLLGANNSNAERFTGLMDEVRLSTFATGTFTTAMLSYTPVPEPSAFAVLAGLGVLGFAASRRRRRVG